MTPPERPMAGLTQDALQAGPLCPRISVLSIFELASRDARRRPLCFSELELGDASTALSHLDEVQRHVHEERCPTCRRWYRNARIAYFDKLRRKFGPFTRRPRKVAAGANHLDYGLRARSRSSGLGALEGRLMWRREAGLDGWGLLVQFRGAGRGDDLSAFDAVALDVYLEMPGRDGPALVATRLDLEGEGLLTSPEEFVDLDHPDRVCRVRIRPRAPLGTLDVP